MIVQCEKCQARFKIPDDKVTSRGVKVRCSRCQHMFRVVKEEASAASLSAPSQPLDDPFARFEPSAPTDPLDKTRPGVFTKGIASTAMPEPMDEGLPPDLFEVPTREQPQLTMPPEEPAAAPAPAASIWEASGFGPGGDAQADSATDFSAPLAEPPTQAAPTWESAPEPSAEADAGWLSGESSEGFAAEPSSTPDPFDPPPAFPGESEEFGAGLELEPAPEAQLPQGSSSAAARDEFFELPARPPAPLEQEDSKAARAVVPVQAVAPATQASGGAAPLQRATRRVTALLANLVVAAVLGVAAVLVANDGKLDAASFAPARLKALLVPGGDLLARDLSSGLYPTREGRPVFFVRGDAQNRGTSASRLKVRVEILDGQTLVSSAEGFAGKLPSVEALHEIAGEGDVEKLHAELEEAAEEVAPGDGRPFLLAFYEYPPELEAFRVKVTVERAQAPRATAR